MNKPIKPKKPHINDKKPKTDLLIRKWVCIDGGGEVFLRKADENEYGGLEDYRGDDLYDNSSISYYQLKRLADLIGKDYDLSAVIYYDGYQEGWLVSWGDVNPEYEKELKAFENRFNTYSYKLKKYEESLNLYNIWKKEREIEALKEKIKKKEKELSK